MNLLRKRILGWVVLSSLAVSVLAVTSACRGSAPDEELGSAGEALRRERKELAYLVQSRIDEVDERVPAIRESLAAVDHETRSTLHLEINEILQLRAALEAGLAELSRPPAPGADDLDLEMRALLGDLEARFDEIHALLGPSAFSPPGEDLRDP